jgi:heme-degrading monooxygenase HmoA
MFARWLVLTVKRGKKIEVLEAVKKEILPIIEKYNGFLSVLPLEPFEEPLKVYVMSLWEDRRDAEKYERESFAAVTHILEPFLVLPPVVEHCTVVETIPKKVAMTAGA